jgi:hypothetical protein
MIIDTVNYHWLFSYWLLFWYFIYCIKLIDYNPTLLLLIVQALIVVFLYIKFFYYGIKTNTYLFMRIIFLKFMPLYILWFFSGVQIRTKDVYFTLGLFIVYNIYLYMHNRTFYEVYTKMSLYRIYNNY